MDYKPMEDDIEAMSNEWDCLVCDIYEAMRDAKSRRGRDVKGRIMAYLYARYFGYDAKELLEAARVTLSMNRRG